MMKIITHRLLYIAACVFALQLQVVQAEQGHPVDVFVFESQQQQQQAVDIAKTLRCPKCVNQNLVESNAPLAKDLRYKVYTMVKNGHSREQVYDYMVERYGERVRYLPSFNYQSLVLWLTPVVLLLFGGVMALRLRRR